MNSFTALSKLRDKAQSDAFKRIQADFKTAEQLEQIEQEFTRHEKKLVI